MNQTNQNKSQSRVGRTGICSVASRKYYHFGLLESVNL